MPIIGRKDIAVPIFVSLAIAIAIVGFFIIRVWLNYQIETSPPSESFMDRRALALANIKNSTSFMVISMPETGPYSNWGFHSVNLNQLLSFPTEFEWSDEFYDADAPPSFPVYKRPVGAPDILVFKLKSMVGTHPLVGVRVYSKKVGHPPHFVRELRPGGIIVDGGIQADLDNSVTLVTRDGMVYLYRYVVGQDGTEDMQLQRQTDTTTNSEVLGAGICSASDMLLELQDEDSDIGLTWFWQHGSTTSQYGQGLRPADGLRALGSSNKCISWSGPAGEAHFLVTAIMSHRFRIYYFPGMGNQWYLLQFVDDSGQRSESYEVGYGIESWDVRPLGNDYDGTGDLRMVVSIGETVKIFRITPYVQSEASIYTVRLEHTYSREETVKDCQWYTGKFHIELEATGTLRLCRD